MTKQFPVILAIFYLVECAPKQPSELYSAGQCSNTLISVKCSCRPQQELKCDVRTNANICFQKPVSEWSIQEPPICHQTKENLGDLFIPGLCWESLNYERCFCNFGQRSYCFTDLRMNLCIGHNRNQLDWSEMHPAICKLKRDEDDH